MLLDYILDHKDEILNIFEKHGLSNVTLMGSVARREESDESDIDFVADFPDLQSLSDAIKELTEYFSRKVEIAPYEQIKECFPSALSRDGIHLFR